MFNHWSICLLIWNLVYTVYWVEEYGTLSCHGTHFENHLIMKVQLVIAVHISHIALFFSSLNFTIPLFYLSLFTCNIICKLLLSKEFRGIIVSHFLLDLPFYFACLDPVVEMDIIVLGYLKFFEWSTVIIVYLCLCHISFECLHLGFVINIIKSEFLQWSIIVMKSWLFSSIFLLLFFYHKS